MSIISTHNSGFFSCCSVKLNDIVNYINLHKEIPHVVDSSKQFKLYKKKRMKAERSDITFEYFEHYDKIKNDNISINTNTILNYHHEHQFKNYSALDYNIIPIVKKYFFPSKKINSKITDMEEKYNLKYDNSDW